MGNLALLDPPSWVDEHAEPDPVAHLIDEAREIVAGQSDQAPRVEHLEALLHWLDGSAPIEPDENIPF